jgi:biopolymer transport protein ExbD
MAGTTAAGSNRRAPISGINVTPLVDVMLVLLVIMMVSATYIVSQTIKVDLPKTATSDGSSSTVAAVTIDAEHKLFLNKKPVDDTGLAASLRSMVAADKAMTLVVSADEKADHGVVVHVLDLARVEGITSFAVNVERRVQ